MTRTKTHFSLAALLIGASAVLAPCAEAASTASPVTPGYLTNTLQPNCTSTPCFVPYGPNGQSVTANPYQYTALGGGQYNRPATTAQSLTSPVGALFARVCSITAQMNFTDSVGATPTTGAAPTSGTPLSSGACIWLSGPSTISNFSLINATASTGVWSAEYYK